MNFWVVSFAILACHVQLNAGDAEPSCSSKIYCRGALLETVQMARIFPDSKTFVDMEMKFTPEAVLHSFNKLMAKTGNQPSRDQVRQFVEKNFQDGNELENWEIPDFNPNPPFLQKILIPEYREFIKDLVSIWKNFSRIIKPEVAQKADRYSIIPVPNGFIIPGGRFREFYYWDSYWIQKGLLLSGMHETVRGMLENFLSMVDRYGFVPNGGRIYYLNRSQPPLLSLMVHEYIKATNNISWLKKNVHLLQKELKYWLKTQTTTVKFEGNRYNLAHYAINSPSPRPESFSEDVKTCAPRGTESGIRNCYRDLKSGAETGWDFSSRWTFTPDGGYGNLTGIQTRRVIPVDLNAFLAQAFALVSSYSATCNDFSASKFWFKKHNEWKDNIQAVLYNKTDGIWYDLDLQLKLHRRGFYPSNLSPLWSGLGDDPKLGDSAAKYLERVGVLKFPGGIPTSLINGGEQWDAPNAWPPLQSLVILGLKRSGSSSAIAVAEELAKKWVDNNLLVFNRTGFMYEKYNAEGVGVIGGGGEYEIQTGFGWTNGEIFELVEEFFSSK